MKRTSTVVAFASGKGGVGKSVLAVNLADTLARVGHRVALVDADLGQGACATLLNATPAASVLDLALRTAHIEDVLHTVAPGFTLVQGVVSRARVDGNKPRLYAALDDLLGCLRAEHAFVLIDAPAGADGSVRWALDRADVGVLTLVGEPTAVAGAYRLAKMIWQVAPAYPMAVAVNLADTEDEARSIAERFGAITRQFVGHMPSYLGWIPFSAQVRQSVVSQTPAVRAEGPVREAFAEMAQRLLVGNRSVREAEGLSAWRSVSEPPMPGIQP